MVVPTKIRYVHSVVMIKRVFLKRNEREICVKTVTGNPEAIHDLEFQEETTCK
jgi:hypothetical protein